MSEQPNVNAMELSAEELETVAGGRIFAQRAAFVSTDFEAVQSSATAGKGFASTDGFAINDETDQAAISTDFVD